MACKYYYSHGFGRVCPYADKYKDYTGKEHGRCPSDYCAHLEHVPEDETMELALQLWDCMTRCGLGNNQINVAYRIALSEYNGIRHAGVDASYIAVDDIAVDGSTVERRALEGEWKCID